MKKNFDVARDVVVKRILEQMEQGQIPWHKPWFGMGACYSYTSGKPYGTMNQCLLSEDGAYITWRSLKKLGGELKEGVEWKDKVEYVAEWFVKGYKVKDEDGNIVTDDNGEEIVKKNVYLRYQSVINTKYTTLPHKRKPRITPKKDRVAEDVISNYVSESGIKFTAKVSDKAFYSPARDRVVIPKIEQFAEQSEFYSTAFHELTHSTGHPMRLNRFKVIEKVDMEDYSREELVAEFGAAILTNYCEVANSKSEKNNAAYLQGWSNAIKDDPKMFVVACARADKAVKMILGE